MNRRRSVHRMFRTRTTGDYQRRHIIVWCNVGGTWHWRVSPYVAVRFPTA